MIKKTSLGSLVVASSLLFAAGAMANTPAPEPGRLTVSAQSQIQAEPDTAIIRATLLERTDRVSQKDSAHNDHKATQAALTRLESRMGQLIRDLERSGVPSRQIKGGTISTHRQHHYQRNSDNSPSEVFIQTQVERPIEIELSNLSRVPDALEMLSHAGIDNISGVEYQLNREERYRKAVLAQAVQQAKEDAQVMASGLDSHLVRVLNVQKHEQHGHTPAPMARSMAMSTMEKSQPAEYRAGKLDISAHVTVTWEIQNAN